MMLKRPVKMKASWTMKSLDSGRQHINHSRRGPQNLRHLAPLYSIVFLVMCPSVASSAAFCSFDSSRLCLCASFASRLVILTQKALSLSLANLSGLLRKQQVHPLMTIASPTNSRSATRYQMIRMY